MEERAGRAELEPELLSLQKISLRPRSLRRSTCCFTIRPHRRSAPRGWSIIDSTIAILKDNLLLALCHGGEAKAARARASRTRREETGLRSYSAAPACAQEEGIDACCPPLCDSRACRRAFADKDQGWRGSANGPQGAAVESVGEGVPVDRRKVRCYPPSS